MVATFPILMVTNACEQALLLTCIYIAQNKTELTFSACITSSSSKYFSGLVSVINFSSSELRLLALRYGVNPFYPRKQIATTSIGVYDGNIVSRKQKISRLRHY